MLTKYHYNVFFGCGKIFFNWFGIYILDLYSAIDGTCFLASTFECIDRFKFKKNIFVIVRVFFNILSFESGCNKGLGRFEDDFVVNGTLLGNFFNGWMIRARVELKIFGNPKQIKPHVSKNNSIDSSYRKRNIKIFLATKNPGLCY